MSKTKEKKRPEGLARLIQIAGTKRWLLLGSMILAVIFSLAQFVPYYAVYKILEELAKNALSPALIDTNLIWYWAWASLIAMGVYGALLYLSLLLSHIAAFNILYEMRVLLALKLPKLPLGYFTKTASGKIKKLMTEEVERIELFVAHNIPDLIAAIFTPIILITFMFIIDWRLALVVFLFFVGTLIYLNLMMGMGGKKQSEMYERYFKVLSDMNASIVEFVRGIQVVKIFNRSNSSFDKMEKNINSYGEYAMDITKSYCNSYVGFYTLLTAPLLFIIPIAAYLLNSMGASASYLNYLPTALFFLLLGGGIFFPMIKLLWLGSYMKQNLMGIEHIDKLLYSEEIASKGKEHLPKENNSIEFRNVSFSYGSRNNASKETENEEQILALDNVSFIAKADTVTALVGASGAGKTTAAMLAARYWDVTKGAILIGGVDIRNIPVPELMDNIAFVFQDNMLFFDTIEENIRMGNKTASMDELIQAAKAAQAHEFIEKLADGYQTKVGEGGTYLSGGEQQRIAIARAILKNSPIVLLDEATAFADPENEGKILEAFSHLIKGKTVLVIAHRLSTITQANQILVFDEGKIVEQGKHDDLLKLKGTYHKMWQLYTSSREWTMKRTEKK